VKRLDDEQWEAARRELRSYLELRSVPGEPASTSLRVDWERVRNLVEGLLDLPADRHAVRVAQEEEEGNQGIRINVHGQKCPHCGEEVP